MTKVTLKTITMNNPSQKIITKDNVSIDIAAVAYYKIIDPQKSVVAIEDITNGVNQISQTTVRNAVGQFSLDQLLSKTIDTNLQIKNVIEKNSTIIFPAQFMNTVQEAISTIREDTSNK